MAIAEQEITGQLSIRITQSQRKKVEQAANATGQSLDNFVASALIRAAEEALMQTPNPLDKVIGIFKNEPLMDSLMERVRKDRRIEMEADTSD